MILTSPVKKYSGTIVLYDNFTLPQCELIEACFDEQNEIKEGERVRFTKLDKPRLPAILACVSEWHLENFPEGVTSENFPMTPRRVGHEVVEFIWNGILKVYFGETEIPNE